MYLYQQFFQDSKKLEPCINYQQHKCEKKSRIGCQEWWPHHNLLKGIGMLDQQYNLLHNDIVHSSCHIPTTWMCPMFLGCMVYVWEVTFHVLKIGYGSARLQHMENYHKLDKLFFLLNLLSINYQCYKL
jgi:hypothetical protein